MASPQVENGHTKIANELLEAIVKMPMSDYEHRIFWLIIRKTYGFKKKQDWISQKQIAEITGIRKSHVSRTIKNLIRKNMVVNTRVGNKKILGIQKDYERWEVTNSGKLPIQVTTKKLPIQVTGVTNSGNSELPLQAPTKETITKETIQNNIYIAPTSKKKSELNKKIVYNFENNKWEGISEDDIKLWNKAYPACNIPIELAKMKDWILSAGPKGRKTNWRRFIRNWLSRCQDRGGTK